MVDARDKARPNGIANHRGDVVEIPKILCEDVLDVFILGAVNNHDELVRRVGCVLKNTPQTSLESNSRTEYRYDDVGTAIPVDAVNPTRIFHWGHDTTRNALPGGHQSFHAGVA